MYIQSNFPLQSFNTFGIAVLADFFVEIHRASDLKYLIDNGWLVKKYLIIGGGSNLLFLCQRYQGLVIKNEIKGIEVIKETNQFVHVKVGAGEGWHDFVMYCIDKGWGGVENLSLIPGTVGAAPIQNIGAYGVEFSDVLLSVDVMDINTGEELQIDAPSCQLGYRSSIFKTSHKGRYVILSVTVSLEKQPKINISYGSVKEWLQQKKQPLTIRSVSQAIIEIRSQKLPSLKRYGNAGSFFKNPVVESSVFKNIRSQYPNIPFYKVSDDFVKIPAAWLIEKCGWKGKRLENVGVHHRQALVLINYGKAEGVDVKKMADDIVESVFDRFHIRLQNEVNFIE